MGILATFLDDHPAVRNPEYRPMAVIDDAERERLEEKIGGAENYGADVLQRLIISDPEDVEYKRAMVSSIVSAEYAGIDAFGRNVARWEDQEVPGRSDPRDGAPDLGRGAPRTPGARSCSSSSTAAHWASTRTRWPARASGTR